jgi:hypothetical protein
VLAGLFELLLHIGSWLFRRLRGLVVIMKWDDVSSMFYERHERYVWKRENLFRRMLHKVTFRTALAYRYERDDFERMRFVGIVFRKLWDLRAELVPRKDTMTFIVAEMSLCVECGTKGT